MVSVASGLVTILLVGMILTSLILSICAISRPTTRLNSLGLPPSGEIVYTTEAQTVSNKTFTGSKAAGFEITRGPTPGPYEFVVADGVNTVLDADPDFGVRMKHFSTLGGPVPTIGGAFGCTAVFSINPTDMCGLIQITSLPSPGPFFFTVTFGQRFQNTPSVILMSPTAGLHAADFNLISATPQDGDTFIVNGVSLVGSTTQGYYYFVVGYFG